AACLAAWAAAAWAAWAAWTSKKSIKHAHESKLLKPASGLEWRHGLQSSQLGFMHTERAAEMPPFFVLAVNSAGTCLS
ncbi:hypothetical protein, partial [Mesorhizobium sp.]|uniref:hypothetical protein n=1 Tax=Mesorhizobium sp. TaxID=1871066 RepID=UPI0025B98AFB